MLLWWWEWLRRVYGGQQGQAASTLIILAAHRPVNYCGIQHFGQQFQRQPHHVRLAPIDHVDPAEPVLIAEGPRLAFPLAAGQVFFELLLR